MLEEQNIVVTPEDVITNKGNGYRLATWIIVENHDNAPTGKSEASSDLIIQRQQSELTKSKVIRFQAKPYPGDYVLAIK